MAKIIDSIYSGGMRVTNYTTEHLLLFDNAFESASFTNSDAYPVDLAVGTVMGRIASTGKVVPFDSGASDGSQFPFAVLMSDYTVEDGETKDLRLVIGGEINGNMLVFAGETDTVETVVSDRRVKDHLQLANIVLRYPDELSNLDNQ